MLLNLVLHPVFQKVDTDISSTNSVHYRQRFNDFMRREVRLTDPELP